MEFQVTSSSAATGKNDIVTRIYSPPLTLSILYESDLENDGSFNGEAEENSYSDIFTAPHPQHIVRE